MFFPSQILNTICEGKYYTDCRHLIGSNLRVFLLLNKNGPIEKWDSSGHTMQGSLYEIILIVKAENDDYGKEMATKFR